MATMSGLRVCPALGVSVIACLRRSERPRVGSEVHDGRWELVKKHVRGFLWCALVCAPSPVLASPFRIWIRLLNECAVGVQEEGEAPAVAFVFLL